RDGPADPVAAVARGCEVGGRPAVAAARQITLERAVGKRRSPTQAQAESAAEAGASLRHVASRSTDGGVAQQCKTSGVERTGVFNASSRGDAASEHGCTGAA